MRWPSAVIFLSNLACLVATQDVACGVDRVRQGWWPLTTYSYDVDLTGCSSLELFWGFHLPIGPEGAEAIAEALKSDTMLRSLDLRHNRIGDAGAAAIAEALKRNDALLRLDLKQNRIGPKGGMAIAEALKTNTVLQSINLGQNNIQDEGGKAVVDALASNVALLELRLHNNNINDDVTWLGQALARALRRNFVLEKLYIGGNKIGDMGGQAIARALKVNEALKRLDLGEFPDMPQSTVMLITVNLQTKPYRRGEL